MLANRLKMINTRGLIRVKSVIFDIADNWGNGTYLGVRELAFRRNGSEITNNNTLASFYSTTHLESHYIAEYAFYTSLSKTGASSDNQWYASVGAGYVTDQRLICVFNTLTTFDTIRINNAHASGTYSDAGIQNVKIYTSLNAITSTVYGEAIANSTKIFDSTFPEHAAVDAAQNFDITLL